ncbi:hypothetical protein PPTG_23694 [Phytophthora nicotianae INRA-310]|uniref:Uncharacterized protein n=1 Tax=Phytophthora nicotianae (strain INRA-310) TaxID=761204 RepID=W2PSZ5_PHYN3|nr:hypothetical protein PPTG_23694 [Phytophthora nicotianae INRA-310]ETN04078.1 hypothetical protein PPTG_23694 [Phytophthora nicotianae INRA-310]
MYHFAAQNSVSQVLELCVYPTWHHSRHPPLEEFRQASGGSSVRHKLAKLCFGSSALPYITRKIGRAAVVKQIQNIPRLGTISSNQSRWTTTHYGDLNVLRLRYSGQGIDFGPPDDALQAYLRKIEVRAPGLLDQGDRQPSLKANR